MLTAAGHPHMTENAEALVAIAQEGLAHHCLLTRPAAPSFTKYQVVPSSVDARWLDDGFTEVSVVAGCAFHIEAFDGNAWRILQPAQLPERDGRVRCFLPIVQSLNFAVLDLGPPEREVELWREAQARGSFELEMAIASSLLHKLLVQNKYLVGATFSSWPSRDRHQLWATLWIALRLVPGRKYTAAEIECLLACHLASPEPSLIASMAADLERRSLLHRSCEEAGDGGNSPTSHFTLSRRQVDFVLDGDKLFHVRACVTVRRPWWSLPIASQCIAAPRPTARQQPATRLRCVLLDPEGDAARYKQTSVRFLPTGGGAPVDFLRVSEAVELGEDGPHNFVAFECEFSQPTKCSEVSVMALADESSDEGILRRLPPFRIDAWEADAQEWRILQCQPMPTAEEMCNHGRGAVRCFLPNAVPLAEAITSEGATSAIDGRAATVGRDPLERLRAQLGTVLEAGALTRWPTKQKQQAAVVLWLALCFLPARVYHEAEVDWIIGTHFTREKVPDCPTIRKEFERYGLVERQPGGGGFQRLEQGLRVALERLTCDS